MQKDSEFAAFTAFIAANIVRDNLSINYLVKRRVALDSSTLLEIPHWLDFSLKTLIHISEFELYLGVTIIGKASLDQFSIT